MKSNRVEGGASQFASSWSPSNATAEGDCVSGAIRNAYSRLLAMRSEYLKAHAASQLLTFAGLTEVDEHLGLEATDVAFDRVVKAEMELLEAPVATLRDLAVKIVIVADDDFASEAMTDALSLSARAIAKVDELAA